MIDRTYVVVGLSTPDLTLSEWQASLVGTPAEADSAEAYALIWLKRVSHRFMRAIFRHESTDGTKGICPTYQTKSPGNCRTSSTGVGEPVNTNVEQWVGGVKIPPAGKDTYIRYPTWAEGWHDMANRLVSPAYPYAKQGARTIEAIIPIWAPSQDRNNPESYIRAVVAYINGRWPDSQPGGTPVQRRPRLAIKAGHHNTSGGNPVEYAIVGPLAEEYYVAALHQGFDVVSAVPDGPDEDTIPGDGNYPGTLYDSARSIVGFNPDVYLSCHTQGGPKTPGMFGIYPDWGSDVDVDARDRLIPLMVKRMTAASGIGQWTDGVMSEKQTYVGSQGDRLGEFRATESIKSTCTRVIFEHGAHDVPSDLAKLQNPEIQRRLVRAGIEAISEFLGWPVKPWDVVGEQPPVEADSITLNGCLIGGGIYQAWKRAGGEMPWGPGVPLNNEHPAIVSDARVEQDFERMRAEWAPGRYPDNWDITWSRTNAELLAAREEIERLREQLAAD